jgi:hypothetical protein
MAMCAVPESDASISTGRAANAASLIGAVLESMRPYQWLKNVLVFIPLAATHRLGESELLHAAACAFVAFSLSASSIYVFNDLHDAPADRLHPHKYRRPIASGRLPRSMALGLLPVLLASALAACLPLGPFVAGLLASYVALMIVYSIKLKTIVLLDALILAAGYGFRIVVGAVAVDIHPCPALLGFCTFFFFSLVLVKRYTELMLLRVRDGPAGSCARLSARGSGGNFGAGQRQRNRIGPHADTVYASLSTRVVLRTLRVHLGNLCAAPVLDQLHVVDRAPRAHDRRSFALRPQGSSESSPHRADRRDRMACGMNASLDQLMGRWCSSTDPPLRQRTERCFFHP